MVAAAEEGHEILARVSILGRRINWAAAAEEALRGLSTEFERDFN